MRSMPVPRMVIKIDVNIKIRGVMVIRVSIAIQESLEKAITKRWGSSSYMVAVGRNAQ